MLLIGAPWPWDTAYRYTIRNCRSAILMTLPLEYGQRWAIEPMFSDFKSRGFGVADTRIRYADRLDRLLLVMARHSTGRCPPACGMPSIIRHQAKKSLADQPKKVARSKTSWFTRGL